MARVMPPGLAELADERAAALEALERLEADRQAGLLDEDDYRLLFDEATLRAARALRALEAPGGRREGSVPAAGGDPGSPTSEPSARTTPDEHPLAGARAATSERDADERVADQRVELDLPASRLTGDRAPSNGPPSDGPFGEPGGAPGELTTPPPSEVAPGGAQHRSRVSAAGPGRATSPRPRRRRWLLGGSVLAFAVAAGVLVGSFATNRLPGQTISGSVRVSSEQRIAEQLVQGRELVAEGRDLVALRLFRTILSEDAGQPEALAYEGWLLRLAGDQAHRPQLVADGRSLISEAIQLDPTYPDAHLFLGLLLAEDDHDLRDAVIQLRLFLADHPSAALVERAGPQIDAAFHEAGLAPPVPAKH